MNQLRDIRNSSGKRNKPSRLQVLTSLSAAAVLTWVVFSEPLSPASAGQSNFMGGNPRIENSDAISTLRLVFPAGVRSNWHSHTWGQLLMVEEGRGRTQDRGGPLMEIGPGQPWFTAAGVEHWHGAAPDVDVLQLTIYEGDVNWLEGVADDVYMATPGTRDTSNQ